MSHRTRARHARRGFTLIELLVVIAIIATLASVIAPSIFSNVGESRRSAAKSQIQILSLALESYRLDNDELPTSAQGLEALRSMPSGGGTTMNWKGPYVRQLIPNDPWGQPYTYVTPGTYNPNGFDLYTLGKDRRAGGTGEDSDVTSWNGPVQ